MDQWDKDAVHAEIMRLSRAMDQLHRMPSYFDPLAQPAPGAERLTTPDDAELTHDDIRGAKVELAERYRTGFGTVESMVQSAHQKSGLGYSVAEAVQVVQQAALSLERGRSEVSESQILELSGRPVVGTFGYAAGDGDEIALSAGTIQETRAMQLSAAGADSAEAVVSRHPELAHLFKAGRTSPGGKHPTGGKKVTSKTRSHAGDLEDSPADRDQPAGKGTHAEVARYLAMREDMFGGEAPVSGSKSYGPSTPAERERGQRRAERSGR
jgi:hypothetical protein